jgi:hypothetical protein
MKQEARAAREIRRLAEPLAGWVFFGRSINIVRMCGSHPRSAPERLVHNLQRVTAWRAFCEATATTL